MSTISERVYQMATGEVEAPALDGSAANRWFWFADLYDHPQWGLAATIPDFNEAGSTVGRLCRATVTGDHNALGVRWDVLSRLAAIKDTVCPTAEHHAWTAVINSGIDAHDFFDDIDFGGTETVTSAFSAIIAAHSATDAKKFIEQAIAAWETYRNAPDPVLEPLAIAIAGRCADASNEPSAFIRAELGVAS